MSHVGTITRPGTRLGLLGLGAVAGLVVATMLAPAGGARPVAAATDPTEHTIAVSGTGVVTVKPDIADVRLGVSIQKPTVKEAQAAAAAAMTSAVAAIRKTGVANDDIKTTTVSLSPVYEYPQGGGQKLVGYQFTNQVAVTVRDLSKVADVIDGAISAGANTVDGVTFRVNHAVAAESQARTAAMADAKARAQALAAAAGVRITGVAQITETSAPMPMPYPVAGAKMDSLVATPISTGTSDVVVTVAVTYTIE
jgi:uncharacterized protein YggE